MRSRKQSIRQRSTKRNGTIPDYRPRPRRRELSCLIAAVLASGGLAGKAAAGEVPFSVPPAISLSADLAFSTSAADLDGDGDRDVLSASAFDNKLAWYENTQGDGSTWTIHTIATDAASAVSVFAADIDGDGDLDAVGASDPSVGITWYENDGSGGAWTPHAIATTADSIYSMVASDVDQDGDVDVVAADRNADEVFWFENDGSGGTWNPHTISSAVDGPRGVTTADVDGDGDTDVFAATLYDPLIAWFENTSGDGSTWSLHTVQVPTYTGRHVFSADIDGDGDADLFAVYSSRIRWFENDGNGGGWAAHTIADVNFPNGVFGIDVDGDGDIDALSLDSNQDLIRWHENDGSGGTWTLRTIATGIDSPQSVFGADLDGDGDADALTASRFDDKIAWFRNDTIHRSGFYTQPQLVSTIGDSPLAVTAADLDDDGDVDLVSGASTGTTLTWHQSDGTPEDGGWLTHTIATDVTDVRDIKAVDLDRDGDPDLAITPSGNDFYFWYENDGTPSDGAWISHSINTEAVDGPWAVDSGDFNGDGHPDLVVAVRGLHRVMWAQSDGSPGDGGWATFTIDASLLAPSDVATSDLNGDGNEDVIAAWHDSDAIIWYESDGDPGGTGWMAHTISNSTLTASALVIADVDGDGDQDVASASRGNDEVSWHENLAGDGSSWGVVTVTRNTEDVSSLLATDVDLDGDVDLAATSPASDAVYWYENIRGDGSEWLPLTCTKNSDGAMSARAADIDGDGDMDLAFASQYSNETGWCDNQGGQLGLPTLDTAQRIVNNNSTHDLLDIEAVHLGRRGDSDAELVTIELKLTDEAGINLTNTEADNLISELRLHLDDGSGEFEPDVDTNVVHTVSAFDLSAGVETIPFTDGNANVQLPFAGPKVYFVVADIASDAQSQTPSAFQVNHLTASSSTGEDAAHDIPLTLEFWPDTGTGVVDTTLSTTSCQAPFDLQLSNRTVTTTVDCQAGTFIRAGDTFVVGSGGDLSLNAGENIRFTGGFHVDTGTLTVTIDSTLKP